MKHNSIFLVTLSLLAGWLLMMPIEESLAADAQQGLGSVESEAAPNVRRGSFDGYDKKIGRVWVDDMAFRYSDQTKVIGTASKLGLISDIKQGETVSVMFEGAGDTQPPFALEIRRQ